MDKGKFELLLGGIGATMISNKATAKSSSLPDKCPTLKEVNKVARKLSNAKKDYNSISNKSKNDI